MVNFLLSMREAPAEMVGDYRGRDPSLLVRGCPMSDRLAIPLDGAEALFPMAWQIMDCLPPGAEWNLTPDQSFSKLFFKNNPCLSELRGVHRCRN